MLVKKTGKLSKSQKQVVWIMIVTVITAIVIFIVVNYVNDYYKATDTAKKAFIQSATIEIVEKEDYYLFTERKDSVSEEDSEKINDAEENADIQEITQGIVFYPGGKVEEIAYAPLLLEFAENGYEVYLVKMPAKLAIFGMNKAEDIFEEASHIKEWTMMGHSLGGAMAASFSAKHEEEVDALVLLAAYSTEDLTEKDIDVFSIYGSEDKVLNMEKYQEYRGNLPEDVVEAVIDGGNHAYYGYYGEQDGDGVADITQKEQQKSVVDIVLSWRE